MNLAKFDHYVMIVTLVVVPLLGVLADMLYAGASRYLAYTATTPSKTDDRRARWLLARARSFVGFVEWVGPAIGKVIPLVRRYVQDAPRPETESTPSLERVEQEETDAGGR